MLLHASLADDLAATGRLPGGDADGFVATVHDAARRGRFTMGLTMFGVVATAPAGARGVDGAWHHPRPSALR